MELQIQGRSASWEDPAAPGTDFLVFARKDGDVLRLVDDQSMLPFFNFPTMRTGDPSGLAQLESDIVSVGTSRSSQATAALNMLFRFPLLSEKSIATLRSFHPQGQSDWSLLRMELIAHQGAPPDIEQLLETVMRDQSAIPDSSHVFEIIPQARISNPNVLEQLSTSNSQAFRFAAMDTIRRLADPQSVPFLAGRLHATDTTVSYVALMAISEITGKHEFATDMATFERNPEPFIQHWDEAAGGASSNPK